MEIKSLVEFEKSGGIKAFYTEKPYMAWNICKEEDHADYHALALELGGDISKMVRVNQKHTTNIRIVTPEEYGEGVISPAVGEYDGMVTNEEGVILCTVEADCAPVYIYDPIKRAIAMVHSGRKGTAEGIVANAIRTMAQRYGCNPADLQVAIGPCICGSCYEVGEEVLAEFHPFFTEDDINRFAINIHDNKYLLDNKKAIIITLLRLGVGEDNIYDCGVCTYETETVCSYRRDHDGGRMLTGIMML